MVVIAEYYPSNHSNVSLALERYRSSNDQNILLNASAPSYTKNASSINYHRKSSDSTKSTITIKGKNLTYIILKLFYLFELDK